ncbi:hypothetical protein N7539_004907 [Penicillium diatomitis]|uniref:U4/U6.U5 small nuclear ribonucleoprotein 27kDa protein domain-containing protein n=1 Tax=Penicillium diatomitis TaxID=2819901 RepID=A0A9X0BU91_9EURO|nr:uncharacterized protein N7539_004907 [Penicillium diatomitis]KAJ5484919.1 hypothetical protein N7539_004907 [Penicillium diatomitis]
MFMPGKTWVTTANVRQIPTIHGEMNPGKNVATARALGIVMKDGEIGAGLEIAGSMIEKSVVEMIAGLETACEVYVQRKGDKARERSRSPRRNGARAGTRSPPPRGPKGDRRPNPKEARSRNDGRITNGPTDAGHGSDEMDVDFKEDVDEDEMEAMMRKSMGFTKFRTTKNTKVPGNNIYGVHKEKQNEYRQYMNRPGGFNRPLSPSR